MEVNVFNIEEVLAGIKVPGFSFYLLDTQLDTTKLPQYVVILKMVIPEWYGGAEKRQLYDCKENEVACMGPMVAVQYGPDIKEFYKQLRDYMLLAMIHELDESFWAGDEQPFNPHTERIYGADALRFRSQELQGMQNRLKSMEEKYQNLSIEKCESVNVIK